MQNVCVFCGSSPGNDPDFTAEAKKLGRALSARNVGLVYGGGSVGLMEAIADAVIDESGSVQGVIPRHLMNEEHAHNQLEALHITETMHERKAKMTELSDAFIAMPGGFGTFEELMEIITWRRLNLHHKAVIVFNINGYYDQLLSFINYARESGFISPEDHAPFKVATSVHDCISALPFLGRSEKT